VRAQYNGMLNFINYQATQPFTTSSTMTTKHDETLRLLVNQTRGPLTTAWSLVKYCWLQQVWSGRQERRR